MLSIGIVLTFLNGCGGVESACMLNNLRCPSIEEIALSFLVTIDELETKNPGIFGTKGGYSRALSLCSIGYTIGGFIGPILSGYMTEELGYYTLGCMLGKSTYQLITNFNFLLIYDSWGMFVLWYHVCMLPYFHPANRS